MSTTEEKTMTPAEMIETGLVFVRRALAFWKRAALTFVVVAGVSVALVFMKARTFRSETVVLYEEKGLGVGPGESGGEGAKKAAARLREMLLSRASLEPLVKEVPRYQAYAERRGIVDAVEELRSHVSFKTREGDMFEISYEGPTPQEAQEVTQKLANIIIKEAAQRTDQQNKTTLDYLHGKSAENKKKLQAAEAELWVFLGQHPEFVPQLQNKDAKVVVMGPTAATGAKPVPIPANTDPVLAGLYAEESNLKAQLAAARAPDTTPAPSTEESDEVKAARAELAQKRAQFTDAHPDVVAAKNKLAVAVEADRKKRAASAQPAAKKLDASEIQALENRLANVHKAIQNHQAKGTGPAPAPTAHATTAPTGTAGGTVSLEVEFRRLQREVENLRDSQKQLDDKMFQAELQQGTFVKVSIVDPAYLPIHASSKPRSTTLATYLAAALGLALALAFISARLDNKIYAVRDLKQLNLIPVVGVIPRDKS